MNQTDAHKAAYDAYLKIRGWGQRATDEVLDAENDGRRNQPDGQHRLAHLVPELAPDQPALARLLVEAALLASPFRFVSVDLLQKAKELHSMLNNGAMHAELERALRPYVEFDLGQGHDLRNDGVRFAMHAALEAKVPATSRVGAPNAADIVANAMRDAGFADITAHTVAVVWADREHKKTRGTRQRR